MNSSLVAMNVRSAGKLTIKLPPAELRALVGNTPDLSEYMMVGSRTANTVVQVLRGQGYALESFQNVLDFACGCGRTLNFIRMYVSPDRLYGCDYDQQLVTWCQRELDIAGCAVNHSDPPFPFSDRAFDFVYAISFFTHLMAQEQRSWLVEWRRVLKDDGLLFLTVLGADFARLAGIKLPKRGFTYEVYGTEFNKRVAYQTRAFAEREWCDVFKILEYQERGLMDHQDVVVLGSRRSLKRKVTPKPPLVLPEELMHVYRKRPDLQEVFDKHGIGRSRTPWRNLNLLDWGLSYGGKEEKDLSRFTMDNFFHVVPT